VTGRLGRGQVVWSGLNLPWLATSTKSVSASELLDGLFVRTARRRSEQMPTSRAHFLDTEDVAVDTGPGATGILYRETSTEGWHATVDGHEVKSYLAGPGMLYVPLTASSKPRIRVGFYYRMTAVERWSGYVSVIGLLGVLVFATGVGRRRRRWRLQSLPPTSPAPNRIEWRPDQHQV
jgi:hypothetical protein